MLTFKSLLCIINTFDILFRSTPSTGPLGSKRSTGVMIRRIAFVVFIGILHGIQGFAVLPAVCHWRRQASSSSSCSIRGTGRSSSIFKGCWGSRSLHGESARPQYLQMSVNDMLGADVESNGLFDPLGFSQDEPSLFRRRAVELKHGRVSMVAMVGILVQSFVRFPGFPPFPVDNAARPLAVMKELWASEMTAVILVILAIGIVELTIGKQDYIDKAPGELGEFGTFAKPVGVEEWEKVQLAEIKHGRLAMLAVVGALVQETVTGEGAVEQLFTGNINPFA